MRRLRCLALVVACGCASSANVQPETTIVDAGTGATLRIDSNKTEATATFDASVDKIWGLLPMVFSRLGVPPGVIDPKLKVMGNMDPRISSIAGESPSLFLRCANQGSGPSASVPQRYEFSIKTTVRPKSDGTTEVATMVLGSARRNDGSSTNASHCTSTGRFEALVEKALRAQLSPK